MKKTYKIDVDCANCANLMEEATRKTEGVKAIAKSSYKAITWRDWLPPVSVRDP